jgi:hypothetical protein
MVKHITDIDFSMSPYAQFYKAHTSESLFGKTPISMMNTKEYWNEMFSNYKSQGIKEEEINIQFYRSENFKKNHDGLHILFTGCSYTFGIGMLYDEVWSKIVYDKICKNNTVSGYYNLGIPGTSMYNQVSQIFKYCNTYGNPDVIFYAIPDLGRFYGYDKKGDNILNAFYKGESRKILKALAFQYYLMLDTYCKTNNINLYAFTWVPSEADTYEDFDKSNISSFDTFYKYKTKDCAQFVIDYKKNNKEKKFIEMARDNDHLGIAYHEYWAKFIYEEWLKDNDNIRN